MEKNMEIRDAPKFVRAVRMDSVPLEKAWFTSEGYLRDRPILTSVGIFEYLNRDGTIRRELRLPEEVFDAESLASYRGKPIVITHDAGLIDKDNVAQNQVGTILSIGERKGNDVVADIVIHDTDELRHSHMKELSLGYNLDLEETPGEWNGEHYDAIQRNIRVNHLAVVRDARAGEQARLNMDGRDNEKLLKGGKKMKEVKKTHRTDEVLSDEELAKAIDEYKKRRAAAANADAEEEEEEVKPAVAEEENKGEETDDIQARIEAVKARRDRRDEQGDPKDVNEAMGVIANQDEDLDTLHNIIDTLLAKLDFDKSVEADSVDDVEKLDGDEADPEEIVEETEEEEPVEEETVDETQDEKDDLVEDEEDVEDPEEDEDTFAKDCSDGKSSQRMDAASIDRLVSQKIMLGELGQMIGLKGLAHKSISDAKRAIIGAIRPEMRLDGKSADYIDAAFEYARAEIKARGKKDTSSQKRQMFNKAGARMDAEDGGAEAARQRMKDRQNKHE